jgi:hypothetical protein
MKLIISLGSSNIDMDAWVGWVAERMPDAVVEAGDHDGDRITGDADAVDDARTCLPDMWEQFCAES